jgi:hypothetical protein
LKRVSLFLAVALLVVSVVGFAPGYLMYSDKPARSDAVVLFVGPGFEDRQQEACQLIAEYKPAFLIVPAYNLVTPINGASISRIRKITDTEYVSFKARKKKNYKPWYEDTHIEVVETMRLMEANGIHTALFVSSPYHLRRIKLIADHQSKRDSFSIRFVPASIESAAVCLRYMSAEGFRWLVREYAKIAWYFLYQPFVSTL